jgi:hypothetical protein
VTAFYIKKRKKTGYSPGLYRRLRVANNQQMYCFCVKK